jgi:subtilisin family serine protease
MFSPLAEIDGPSEVSVQVEDLDRRDIPVLTRDADVQAVAPLMPMKLVEPREGHDTISAETVDNIAWGVKAVKADTSALTGDGIVVAILDTGINAGHSAFAGVELVLRNFTNEADADTHGHGTHCAGTIFGEACADWQGVGSRGRIQ